MIPGILAKKVGMTQVFQEDGVRLPVTVIEAGPCQVYEIKNVDKDGYDAVKLAFNDAKEKNLNKPQREEIKKKNLMPKRFVREIKCSEAPDVNVGDEMKADLFQQGDFVDVTGVSKGKGFQGGMKRHGWSGGNDTHGSMSHRAPGSIGQSSYPSRVFKGLGMPGHMGSEKVTVQNLKIVEVDVEKNVIIVEGAVPGAIGSYLVLRFAKKKKIAERQEKPEYREQMAEDREQRTEDRGQQKTEGKEQTEESKEQFTDDSQQTTESKEKSAEKKKEKKEIKKETNEG